jgi:hypothetical protein
MSKIIAVDFDKTLCYSNYPELGEPNLTLIEILKRLKNQGHRLILWTCRTNEPLEAAVKWCTNHGLTFDSINEDVPGIGEELGIDGSWYDSARKVYADIYIDDKCVSVTEFNLLEGLL